MKHLKRFNESLEDDIKEFAETLFVNLLDDGFEVETKYSTTNVEVYIYKSIGRSGSVYSRDFFYSDIEDEVKTFVDYMKRKWEHIDLIYKYEDLYSETRAKSKEPLSSTRIVGSTTGRPPSLKLIVKKMDKKPNFFTKISKRFHHTWTDL